ncbi:hypothetical protein [Pelagicoccus albus]|uniref:Uncharacterized protein n=1 Tax=Pelagicoccus albus TaxID=415222 RepID=A0A7X1B754_9BACT|nr:hypothetical protein [Pelagicoccus albus]MBC2606639.1 hypothetical protein [Pelagicoccus albus]
MSTHAVKGTRVENDEIIRFERQSETAADSLLRQLAGLLDATMCETWLPMGFRAMVVQEIPSMRQLVEKGRSGLAVLLSYVSHLREEAEPYRAFAKRSAALLALRNLENELRVLNQTA